MSQKNDLHSLRGVPELKYINADNVTRYRAIMKFLYQQYQKLNYWLKPEQIFEEVVSWKVLKNYTFEQCQLDLEQLVEWGNLTSRHYGERATSVEEYLKKKFQYLLTPYSIEIERLLENLESVRGYGGSLEPTLFDTIANTLFKIRSQSGTYEKGEALELWNTLNESFQKVHEASVDYIASLQTGKAEELMVTDAFLIYKDAITNYLRDFVHALQRRSYKIEGNLAQVTGGVKDIFLTSVTEDEWRIPKLEETISKEEYYTELVEKWGILNKWFQGEFGSISEMQLLERATKEAIMKMVRSALRIQEKKRSIISRRKDLEFLGQWFYKMDSLESAHKLAAYTFGLFPTRHFHGEDTRDSDSAGMSMWLETPIVKTLRSRSRKRHDRHDIEAAIDNTEEKERLKIEFIKKQKQELQFLKKMVERKSISVSQIEKLPTTARLQLLEWIGRCNAAPHFMFQSSEGVQIQLTKPVDEERANLLCEDGTLELINYKFTFTVIDKINWHNLLQWENKE
ncbi:TIGR02677 family protein [Paenibacillus doosanensis]|uniref:TIGR02677 family protein n=1 Tax=Paenibacillus doosanensis TaxID=1229154 RepID=UPI0021809902|nr:TIGR02677 family protein [Paenibacillus doosanensis]MCS7463050.1 TIGR02677 family protein [Paenibacillus doosanensis]